MKTYLYRGTLTASKWRELLAHPRDIGQEMRTSIERFGGKVVACYFYGNNPNGFLEFPTTRPLTRGPSRTVRRRASSSATSLRSLRPPK